MCAIPPAIWGSKATKLQRARDYEVSRGIYWNIIPTVNIEIAEPFFISRIIFSPPKARVKTVYFKRIACLRNIVKIRALWKL